MAPKRRRMCKKSRRKHAQAEVEESRSSCAQENLFLKLPRELRDQIYTHLLPQRITLATVWQDHGTPKDFYDRHGFLLVSKQIRHEALEMLYSTRTFALPGSMADYAETLPTVRQRKRVKRLRWDVSQDLNLNSRRGFFVSGTVMSELGFRTWSFMIHLGSNLEVVMKEFKFLKRVTFEIFGAERTLRSLIALWLDSVLHEHRGKSSRAKDWTIEGKWVSIMERKDLRVLNSDVGESETIALVLREGLR